MAAKKNKHKTKVVNLKRLSGFLIKNGKIGKGQKKLLFFFLDYKIYRKVRNKFLYLKPFAIKYSQRVKPSMGLRNKKIAGKKHKIPYLLKNKRSARYSLKWFGEEIGGHKFKLNSYKLNSFLSLKLLDDCFKGGLGFFSFYLERHNKEVLEHRMSSRFF